MHILELSWSQALIAMLSIWAIEFISPVVVSRFYNTEYSRYASIAGYTCILLIACLDFFSITDVTLPSLVYMCLLCVALFYRILSLLSLHSMAASPVCPLSSQPYELGTIPVIFFYAHPDDESMFTTPLLQYMSYMNTLSKHSPRYEPHLVCLSDGNAANLGVVRQKELILACTESHNMKRENVHIIDDPLLTDSMTAHWKAEDVAKQINIYMTKTNSIINAKNAVIITFDNKGVSSHPNHIGCHLGAGLWYTQLLKEQMNKTSLLPNTRIHVWNITTLSLLSKYSFFWSAAHIMSQSGMTQPSGIVSSSNIDNNNDTRTIIIPAITSIHSWSAMAQHYSQWVWFRKLFVLFSAYTYITPLTLYSITY